MEWFTHNWVNILAIVGAADGLFYAITIITPSTADDNVYRVVHNFVIKFFQPKQ